MKFRFLLAFLSILTITTTASAVTVDWLTSYYAGHRLIRFAKANDGDGFMLAGFAMCREGEYPNYTYFNELVLTRTDGVGQELFYKRTRFNYDPVPRDIIRLETGGYLVVGAVGNSSFSGPRNDFGLFTAVVNEEGEVVKDRVYNLNLPFGTMVIQGFALPDGGMIATAVTPFFYDSNVGKHFTTEVLVRIDGEGNQLFRHEFVTPDNRYPGLALTADGEFWLVTLLAERTYDPFGYAYPPDFSYVLRKFDEAGQELIETVTPVGFELDYVSVAATPDGGLLAWDRWRYSQDLPATCSAVSRFDALGNLTAIDWVPDTRDAHNVHLIPLADGSYYFLTSRRGYFDSMRLMKMDSAGNLVWDYIDDNKFSYVTPYDALMEPDGDLVVIGSIIGSGLFHFDMSKEPSLPPLPPQPPNPDALSVSVDVLPGNNNNKVNPQKNGVLPVAILSAPGFSAATVDPSTVSMSGMLPKYAGDEVFFLLKDVNKDGIEDLVLHMDASTLVGSGGGILTLVGVTGDGRSIAGYDEVELKDK